MAHLLELLEARVVARHVCLVVLAVVQLHDFSTDDGLEGAA